MVNLGCAQIILKEGVLAPHTGGKDINISIVCMYGASYTYPQRQVCLTIMGRTEETAVGFVHTLPCPMLLGQDWPYFHEVINQALGCRCKTPTQRELSEALEKGLAGKDQEQGNRDLLLGVINLGELISEGQFREDQEREPKFYHIYADGIAKQDEKVLQPNLMSRYLWFEARDGLLYCIEKGRTEVAQVLAPQKYW